MNGVEHVKIVHENYIAMISPVVIENRIMWQIDVYENDHGNMGEWTDHSENYKSLNDAMAKLLGGNMFVTYFCKDGTIVDIDEFSDRQSAEKAVQGYYEDDLDQGEWEDGVYGVRDTDEPKDWHDERILSDVQPDDDNDEEDDDEDA